MAAGSGAANGVEGAAHFDACRARVAAFSARHFTWPGAFALHRAALGWDILRAPVNVVLSVVFALSRLAALLFRQLGRRRTADWLTGRRILLRTDVARQVELLVVTELLGLPLPEDARPRDPDALGRAVLAAPALRELIRRRAGAGPDAAAALGRRIAGALGDYAGTRSAVADLTTALAALAVGALVFRALTPGMVSMAPGLAEALARAEAVAGFPLGPTLGGLWHAAVPVTAPPGLVAAAAAGLVTAGAVAAAFAGVLADPVQHRLGIHRRRLLRLIAAIEGDLTGAEAPPFRTREHYLARIFDLWDALAGAVRIFRG